jgi:hypothetical protein
MTDVIITLTLDEAKALLQAAERDVDEYHVDQERAVVERLATKIQEAERERSAYDAAAMGQVHWADEQLYQGPSRYSHPGGGEAPQPD